MKLENKSNIIKITVVLIIIVLTYLLFFKTKSTKLTIPPPLVTIQNPTLMKMSEYITQTGNTVAYNSVSLVARVQGFLEQIQFTDGSFVKKDSPLFVIEPEPYWEQLQEAKASLAVQQANLAYAETEYKRQQQMYKENATSLNSVQKWLTKRDEALANVAQAKANLVSAKITYSYTHIKAPFDGRIGRHLVDEGNLVGHGEATPLATIEQINPIYVYFNINELDLLTLRTAANAQGITVKDINKIPVAVGLQNETGFPHKGHLDFVNTGLNASTGTMQFRAILPNKDFILVPGLFVQIRIIISPPSPQLTVPNEAIQYDQIGAYLLLVNEQQEVVQQRVELGELAQGVRVIKKGINKNDNVIVDGIQYATPGLRVKTQRQKSVG